MQFPLNFCYNSYMSEAVQRLEKIAGASIGKSNEARKPFLDSLASKTSVIPDSNWVNRVRNGCQSGYGLLIKVELDLADKTSSFKKDELYERIAAKGINTRVHSQIMGFEHRYASGHLVDDIAESLKLTGADVRQFLRAMRVDLAFGDDTDDNLNTFFVNVAEEYLWANTEALKPSARYKFFVDFNDNWDRKSPHPIRTFYQALYADYHKSSRRIGSFVPYELDVMRFFYGLRVANETSPTLFDQRTYECDTLERNLSLVEDVRIKTGILIDDDIVVKHRNALVYGQPVSGRFQTRS